MEKTQEIAHKNIFAALSAFQGELTPIEQSGKVSFKTKGGELVDYTYAPLSEIMRVIYPLLARHGLSVRHELGENNVEAILTHETSEQKEVKKETHYQLSENAIKDRDLFGFIATNELRSGKLPVDMKKAEMKDVGAQITYARRYTLALVLGLSTDEDKDTQLLDEARKNTENFAFSQAKKALENVKPEEMAEKVVWLEGELKLAQDIVDGNGTKAPALGLKPEQYLSLIALAKAKLGKEIITE